MIKLIYLEHVMQIGEEIWMIDDQLVDFYFIWKKDVYHGKLENNNQWLHHQHRLNTKHCHQQPEKQYG